MLTNTASAGDDYSHADLPHALTHVRLLEVSPIVKDGASTSAEVNCRLRTVRLVDYDSCYTALSYTWDHGAEFVNIYVNGRPLRIRKNVYDFLCVYREQLMLKALPTVFLWIDAVCIDYGNIKERNGQVQIMPSIYQRATTVLAWLEADPALDSILGHGVRLRAFVAFLSEIHNDLERPISVVNNQLLINKYVPQHGGHFPASGHDRSWHVMLRICSHYYWDRLWIVPENRFAQNLLYMHGNVIWTWEEFRAPFVLVWALMRLGLYQSPIDDDGSGIDLAELLTSPAGKVVQTRLELRQEQDLHEHETYGSYATDHWTAMSERTSLAQLLHQHQNLTCTETLDKIYALVGLAETKLTIDYNRTNIELFCGVLLSVCAEVDKSFVYLLGKFLNVHAFNETRMSVIFKMEAQNLASMPNLIGQRCHKVYSVKAMNARTELQDVIQARLGLTKLNFYRVMDMRDLDKLEDWTDLQAPTSSPVKPRQMVPGQSMPIVDGFDLSDARFRACLFLNNSYNAGGKASRRALMGLMSTGSVQPGDVICSDPSMHAAIVLRISGLAKSWLTVIGVILFARRVVVESNEYTPPSTIPSSPTSSFRSAGLSEFCEHTMPTSFTITKHNDKESFTLEPQEINLRSFFERTRKKEQDGFPLKRAVSTTGSISGSLMRRLNSRSDRLERALDLVTFHRRRHTK